MLILSFGERGPKESRAGDGSCRLRNQLPQHERKDAAMPVVFDLDRRVYAERDGHFVLFAVRTTYVQRHDLTRIDLGVKARDFEDIGTVAPQKRRVGSL